MHSCGKAILLIITMVSALCGFMLFTSLNSRSASSYQLDSKLAYKSTFIPTAPNSPTIQYLGCSESIRTTTPSLNKVCFLSFRPGVYLCKSAILSILSMFIAPGTHQVIIVCDLVPPKSPLPNLVGDWR